MSIDINPFIPKKLCTMPRAKFIEIVSETFENNERKFKPVSHVVTTMNPVLISPEAFETVLKAEKKPTAFVFLFILKKLIKDKDKISFSMDELKKSIPAYSHASPYSGLQELEKMEFICKSKMTMERRSYYINPAKLFSGNVYNLLASSGGPGTTEIVHTMVK